MTRPTTDRRPAWRKAYGGARAKDYEALMRMAVGPLYKTILETVAESFRLKRRHGRPRLLDLGAGTGNVAKALLEAMPGCKVTCLDGSSEMLAVARRRLGADKRVSFTERDFASAGWTRGLGPFDGVMSFGAIHHLDGEGKHRLFGRIHRLLRDGGIFVCADRLKGGSSRHERVYEDAWARLIQKNLKELEGRDLPLRAIRKMVRRIGKDEGDRPSTLSEQLRWLGKAGFKDVDCDWKRFGLAVFSGVRRPGP